MAEAFKRVAKSNAIAVEFIEGWSPKELFDGKFVTTNPRHREVNELFAGSIFKDAKEVAAHVATAIRRRGEATAAAVKAPEAMSTARWHTRLMERPNETSLSCSLCVGLRPGLAAAGWSGPDRHGAWRTSFKRIDRTPGMGWPPGRTSRRCSTPSSRSPRSTQ